MKDIIKNNRSYRRFLPEIFIDKDQLIDLVDSARFIPSAMNQQVLRYRLSTSPETNSLIFSTLKWGGYIEGWDGPAETERPSAYIIILSEGGTEQYLPFDVGIAAQTIMLDAVSRGLTGCMLGSVDRAALREKLNISDIYQIQLVLALGEPSERVEIEEIGKDDDKKYWRDDADVHHVPKVRTEDLIVG